MIELMTNGRSLMVKVPSRNTFDLGMFAEVFRRHSNGGGWDRGYVDCADGTVQEKHSDGGVDLCISIMELILYTELAWSASESFQKEVNKRMREDGQGPYFRVS